MLVAYGPPGEPGLLVLPAAEPEPELRPEKTLLRLPAAFPKGGPEASYAIPNPVPLTVFGVPGQPGAFATRNAVVERKFPPDPSPLKVPTAVRPALPPMAPNLKIVILKLAPSSLP